MAQRRDVQSSAALLFILVLLLLPRNEPLQIIIDQLPRIFPTRRPLDHLTHIRPQHFLNLPAHLLGLPLNLLTQFFLYFAYGLFRLFFETLIAWADSFGLR